MPRCFLPKKTGGREAHYFPPPRVRSPSPTHEQIWIPRSPTAGETAPSPPPCQTHAYTPSGYPLDLHITSSPPRHVYYGEVSRPPDTVAQMELLPPDPATMEVVHQGVHSTDRIVQVHIPELPHSPQYYPQSPHKIPLFYSGEYLNVITAKVIIYHVVSRVIAIHIFLYYNYKLLILLFVD